MPDVRFTRTVILNSREYQTGETLDVLADLAESLERRGLATPVRAAEPKAEKPADKPAEKPADDAEKRPSGTLGVPRRK